MGFKNGFKELVKLLYHQKVRFMKKWEKEAFRLYVLGLTSKEIGKMLDLSYRTIQGAMSRGNWKEQRNQIRKDNENKIIKRYQKRKRYAESKK